MYAYIHACMYIYIYIIITIITTTTSNNLIYKHILVHYSDL